MVVIPSDAFKCLPNISLLCRPPQWRPPKHGWLLWPAGPFYGAWECEFLNCQFLFDRFIGFPCFNLSGFCCRNATQLRRGVSPTGGGGSWTESWLRTQKVSHLVFFSLRLTFLNAAFSSINTIHACLLELFQDLSQLQEIWIAEGKKIEETKLT